VNTKKISQDHDFLYNQIQSASMDAHDKPAIPLHGATPARKHDKFEPASKSTNLIGTERGKNLTALT
jgi:hypothetical protein